MIEVMQEGNYAVIFPSRRVPDFEAYQRALYGARYLPDRQVNIVPIEILPEIVLRLREIGLRMSMDAPLHKIIQSMTALQWVDLKAAQGRVERMDQEIRELEGTRGNPNGGLYEFQKYGIQWLSTRTTALLADDMGTGKTLQTLGSLPADCPTLVICPASVKSVWQEETRRWRPHISVEVLEGRDSFRWPEQRKLLIVNYDVLPPPHVPSCKDEECTGCARFLLDCPPHLTTVGDELHSCKSMKSARARSVSSIMHVTRRQQGRTWGLTGTPLLNTPPELWTIFSLLGIALEAFGSKKRFLSLFNATRRPEGGYEWGTPEAEVDAHMKRVMLRRKKEDVLKDLPKKSFVDIEVEIDSKAFAVCDDVFQSIGGDKGLDELEQMVLGDAPIPFERISEVRAVLAAAKIPAMLDRIEHYEGQNEPLVVASAHRAPIDILLKRKGWKVITGDVSSKDRAKIVHDFQAGRLKGVGLTIDAGGVGITLTRAAYMVMVDEKFTPGLNEQVVDRIYRIGQRRNILVERLVANHRMDKRLAVIVAVKKMLNELSVERARHLPEDQVNSKAFFDTKLETQGDALNAFLPASQVPPPDPRKIQPPSTALQEWCARALRTLDDLDPDRALEVNGVGFSKVDGPAGGSLRRTLDAKGGLSEAQWKMAIQICKKYRKQVGDAPTG